MNYRIHKPSKGVSRGIAATAYAVLGGGCDRRLVHGRVRGDLRQPRPTGGKAGDVQRTAHKKALFGLCVISNTDNGR